MNDKVSLKFRIGFTLVVTLLVWAHITWDYFHGGIPTHYIFHSDDFPGIPNWWGALVLPFFTWFLLYRIHKRVDGAEPPVASKSLQKVLLRMLAAAAVAIAISICYMNGIDATDYIMGAVVLTAFFLPLYKSEYLLGWVLGASFSFGAMIPMVFGSLLAGVFFVFHLIFKTIKGLFRKKKPPLS